jgi:ribokinase
MSNLLVTGYASLDYPVSLAGTVQPDKTTHITYRDPRAWPRTGGSPYYVTKAAVKLGMNSQPITWVGKDELAQKYLDDCDSAGISTSGVAQLTGQRSPTCLLIHQGDGSTSCLFDPAFSGKEAITDGQREMLAKCKNICITVGPGHLVAEILSLVVVNANLYWVTKNDERAFPAQVCQQLAQKSLVIFCNQSERPWIEAFNPSAPIIVQTQGAGGCKIIISGKEEIVSARSVKTSDPTGAGDTFAGGFIEALCRTGDPKQAARIGMDCARELLERRGIEG